MTVLHSQYISTHFIHICCIHNVNMHFEINNKFSAVNWDTANYFPSKYKLAEIYFKKEKPSKSDMTFDHSLLALIYSINLWIRFAAWATITRSISPHCYHIVVKFTMSCVRHSLPAIIAFLFRVHRLVVFSTGDIFSSILSCSFAAFLRDNNPIIRHTINDFFSLVLFASQCKHFAQSEC